MISTVMAAPILGVRTGVAARSEDAREAAAPALPSAEETRRARQDQQKAMASQRLDAVRQRFKALKLMIGLDPKAALRMATDMAREVKAAVKAYRDAGGRNVSTGELALIRRQASEAADAQQAEADTQMAEAQAANAERWDQAEVDATADWGFFELVRGAVGGLREAHDKIRAQAPQSLSRPDEDDWKAAEKAQSELEREVAFAAGGVSIRV